MKTQDLLDLIRLGVQMRAAQKRYFDPKTRSRDALNDSVALEREFDAAAKKVTERYGEGSVGDANS